MITRRISNLSIAFLETSLIVPEAAVRSSFTTPIVLVPEQPGYYVIPLLLSGVKFPGSAYSIIGINGLFPGWDNGAIGTNTDLDKTLLQYTTLDGNFLSFNQAKPSIATILLGKNFVIAPDASPAGGSGAIKFVLRYYLATL